MKVMIGRKFSGIGGWEDDRFGGLDRLGGDECQGGRLCPEVSAIGGSGGEPCGEEKDRMGRPAAPSAGGGPALGKREGNCFGPGLPPATQGETRAPEDGFRSEAEE